MTNNEFADLIGCNYTFASRLRNGQRLPSGTTLAKIISVFRLDPTVALAKYSKGREVFSGYLRENVFEMPVHLFVSRERASA